MNLRPGMQVETLEARQSRSPRGTACSTRPKGVTLMTSIIFAFRDLAPEQRHLAGGKGGTLAQLFQGGYPIPDGLVLLPTAFAGDELLPEAWRPLQTQLARLRGKWWRA